MQCDLEILMFFEICKLFDFDCCNSLKLLSTIVINYRSFTITRLYCTNKAKLPSLDSIIRTKRNKNIVSTTKNLLKNRN